MLSLTKDQISELIEHSKNGSPNEVCGILAGRDGNAEKIYKMTNKDESNKTFFMDPQEQLKVMKEIRGSSLDFIGIYHSHPETKAYPSTHDVELTFYPEVSYVIVSLKDKDSPDIKSFRIVDQKITPEEIKIV